MNDALVCLAILFAVLVPVTLFHVWAAESLGGAAHLPLPKQPRLTYVPPASTASTTSGPARYRPVPTWTQARRAYSTPVPERPAVAPLPLAMQARQAVAEGSRARIVRLARDADPGQRGLWLRYLIEHDGICFN